MKKKRLFLVIAIIAVLALVGCSGKKDTSSSSNTSGSSQSGAVNADGNDRLFDITKNQITSSLPDKDAALAEIPAELFKGIGKLTGSAGAAVFNNSVDDNYKYTVQFKFDVDSGEDAAKTLMDYYESIGGTVTKTGSRYYDVTFDWGKSVEIMHSSFEGQDYMNLQFSVVKE